MSPQPITRSGSIAWGVFLLLAGGVAFYFLKDISSSAFSSSDDPGPKTFPRILSILMMMGGVYEGVCSYRNRSEGGGILKCKQFLKNWGTDQGLRQVLILILALGLYIPALGLLGFTSASLGFSTLMMWRLGTRPLFSLIMSAVLVALIRWLFVVLFKVPLPESSLGIPF
ncbi:MAG TPA: tripartite tricarboxylate transporter TctB family protein [Verrucomicrobiales bacterium]|nr:tripartite tricarboxylate transporter TctB family protein [Verrucomicrobiales bacterium]HIL72134.1 tripartite tricarboxylate transporter TctB family protein [Verrucomicrobiota bacterium]